MNIEILGRQAIDRIKSEWGLPKRGFIAGGSLANIIWELVSGNKAIVNDIDVFVFGKLVEKEDSEKESLFDYREKELNYYEDYTGVCFTAVTKDFYTISESTRDGIFNTITYDSNTKDPSLVLSSFDINCTRIGYSIEEDKLYWTSDFEEFIKTGDMRICNIMTPSHTAIRLAKKSKELNVKLDTFEFELVQHTLNRKFMDTLKTRFKERYFEMYKSNEELLKPFFNIERDSNLEAFVKTTYNVEDSLYYLEPINNIVRESDPFDDLFTITSIKNIFDDDNLMWIFRSNDFLFYMRNIFGNKELSDIWKDIYYFWKDDEYIDREVTKEDIDLLSKFAKYAPSSINNLKGMKLSEQINIINKFLDKFKDDPIIAISILENIKLDKDIVLDDQMALLLELSVRKEIINDTRGKVRNILNIGGEPPIDVMPF